MDYIIQLSGKFNISEDEFIHAWNTDKDFTNLAVARKSEKSDDQYFVVTMGAVTVILGTIAVNIASSAIYDFIKLLIAKAKAINEITIEERQNENNSTTVIVDEKTKDSKDDKK